MASSGVDAARVEDQQDDFDDVPLSQLAVPSPKKSRCNSKAIRSGKGRPKSAALAPSERNAAKVRPTDAERETSRLRSRRDEAVAEITAMSIPDLKVRF